jgi:putative hydrolase of the HAD superfamily
MNIVFDLGGVVFRWQPEKIIRHVFQDPRKQDLVRSEIFEHADWVELDRGTITLDQAIVRGASRTGLPRGEVEELLKSVPQFLTPIEETIELIRDIRGSNNSFFVLSNMHAASISYLEETHEIWNLFDGIVISSRIQMVKPEIEIYEHLLTTYGLNAAETVFIDDMSENLATAAKIGINTIRFLDADQCRQALIDLGCF